MFGAFRPTDVCAAQPSKRAFSCHRLCGSFERGKYANEQKRLAWSGTSSPRLKIGRKTGGECLGIGRDPVLVLVQEKKRQELMMELVKVLSRWINHRQCMVKAGTLSNADKYVDNTLTRQFHEAVSERIASSQSPAA